MNFYSKDSIKDILQETSRVILSLENQSDKLMEISKLIFDKISNNNKILIAGNGGSSADAQHFSGELTCTLSKYRRPFPAINLSDNQAALTAWSNDYKFESFYERQVEAHGKNGDILFLISTSGGNLENRTSINLLNACDKAKSLGISTISLLGKTGGELKNKSDYYLLIPSDNTTTIQEAHIVVIHLICRYLDTALEK